MSSGSNLGGSVAIGGSDEATAVGNGLDVDDGCPDLTLTLSNDSDEAHSHQDDDVLPYQGTVHPLPVLNYLVGDFTRRFERQSWRERHEEERRRLKEKFEVSMSQEEKQQGNQ